MNSTPLYEEKQYYHWFVYGLCALPLLMIPIPYIISSTANRPIPAGATLPGVITSTVMLAIIALLMRQSVTVLPGEVVLSFGWVNTWRKRIDLSEVATLEAVQFSPVRDFGGWGIKRGRDGIWCYNVKGNTGVHLRGPKTNLIIGTQYPDALLAALKAAKGEEE